MARLRWRFGLAMLVAAVVGAGSVAALADGSRIGQALAALDTAQSNLAQTSDNKGGHPAKAIVLIKQARAELAQVTP